MVHSNLFITLITINLMQTEFILAWKLKSSMIYDGKFLHYEVDDMLSNDTDLRKSLWFGSGREISLFDGRGGDINVSSDPQHSASRPFEPPAPKTSSSYKRKRMNKTFSYSRSASSTNKKPFFSSIKDWIQTGNLPKIQCRVEPNTTLKVRKTFRPLKTIIKLGADFNTQLGVWQFKSSWEDEVIGGKLSLSGRELQFSKTWLLSVGAVEDLVTRLRMRAAVDLGTMKAYARLGFRTERLSPINVVEGFTLMKRLPLDGNDGHVKLEVKANFAFPEPEIAYSTENHRSFVGMGDIEVNIDELNLILDY